MAYGRVCYWTDIPRRLVETETDSQVFISLQIQLASILQFGHDPKLQQTREWILEKEGYRVRNALSAKEFRTAFLADVPNVLLLCQTLDAEDCDRATEFAAEHAPGTRCIVLFSNLGGWTLERDHVLLRSNDGPKTFLETIKRVVNGSAQPSQG